MVNPHESNHLKLEHLSEQSNIHRFGPLQGFCIGAGLPIVLGMVMLVRFQMSLSVLPPGQGHCGTGGLGAICMILLGTPIGAVTGAIAGFILRYT